MSGTSIFIGTTSCFRLGPLKSGMFNEVESNVKMKRCKLQGGDGKVGMARWRLESMERLPNWKMLGAGRGCFGGGGWRGGQGCWGGGSCVDPASDIQICSIVNYYFRISLAGSPAMDLLDVADFQYLLF